MLFNLFSIVVLHGRLHKEIELLKNYKIIINNLQIITPEY